METPGITLRQVFWLFVNSRFVITLVFIPQFNEVTTNRDILPFMMLLAPLALLYGSIFILLWSQYPDQTLIEYSSSIFGRFAGKAVGILYIGYFILHASITVRIFEEFLITRFFIRTPIQVIGLGILLIAAYCIYMGLEVLGRCADVLVPLIFLGILLLVGLAMPSAHWTNVIPTWETGMARMSLESIPTTTRWNEFVWMAMIIPSIVNKQHIRPAIYAGILFDVFFWYIVLVPIVAILGPEVVKHTQFPTYALVEIISIGQFLDRIDALVLGMWVFGAFLKIGIFYYVAVMGAAQCFGIKDHKPLILPIGLMIMCLSLLLFSNIVELRSFGKASVPFEIIVAFVIPLVMLIIHCIKKQVRLRRANT